MTEPTTDQPRPDEPAGAGDEIHARLDFTAKEDGSLDIGMEAVQAPENAAVHFACWLYENREALAAMAKNDFQRMRQQQAAQRVILSGARRLAGPDGSPLN